MAAPAPDQLEVSLIGPGFGETAVVHVGDNRWVLIDSCINAKGEPAALAYLASIGVDPSRVELIVVTHWHDDHVRGVSALADVCKNAVVVVSLVTTDEEFLTVVDAYNDRPMTAFPSGLSELHALIRDRANVGLARAMADTRLSQIAAGQLSHGQRVEVWSLSPCQEAITRFFVSLGTLMPNESGDESKRRAPVIQPNECSVVVLFVVGDVGILLGADLEDTDSNQRGWQAIVASSGRPQLAASYFKVPHHGGKSGHNDDAWKVLVTPQPVATLAPFNRGSKLPTKDDVARILGLTKTAYSTSRLGAKKRKFVDPTVDKIARELGPPIDRIDGPIGRIEARLSPPFAEQNWEVSRYDGAVHLSDVHDDDK